MGRGDPCWPVSKYQGTFRARPPLRLAVTRMASFYSVGEIQEVPDYILCSWNRLFAVQTLLPCWLLGHTVDQVALAIAVPGQGDHNFSLGGWLSHRQARWHPAPDAVFWRHHYSLGHHGGSAFPADATVQLCSCPGSRAAVQLSWQGSCWCNVTASLMPLLFCLFDTTASITDHCWWRWRWWRRWWWWWWWWWWWRWWWWWWWWWWWCIELMHCPGERRPSCKKVFFASWSSSSLLDPKKVSWPLSAGINMVNTQLNFLLFSWILYKLVFSLNCFKWKLSVLEKKTGSAHAKNIMFVNGSSTKESFHQKTGNDPLNFWRLVVKNGKYVLLKSKNEKNGQFWEQQQLSPICPSWYYPS